MMGSAINALLGGIHYWWPKITGRMYAELPGKIAWAIIFLGFNLTFFPQFILGTRGMPRRYYNYPPEFTFLHQLSTVGAFVLAAGFTMVAVYLLRSLFTGPRAPANPWGGATLEWACSSPPPTDNFARPPTAGDPYDYRHLRYDPQLDGYVRTDRPDPSGGPGP
jgi:cytochrome c oxidase subunit 1